MKYAIVEHSGKQYMAQEGDLIEVDRMPLEIGKQVVFKDVLFVTDGKKSEVGSPFVKGASVKGKVKDHPKGRKITVFKYKPKQRYRRKQGHRQLLTHVSIESIGLPKAEKAEAKSKSKAASGTAKKESGATPKKKSTGSAKKGSASTAKKSGASTAKKSGTSTAKKSGTSTAKKSGTSTTTKSSSSASKKGSTSKSETTKKE